MDRIVIEFEPSASPISGRVTASQQPTVPFTGWTGLFAVLHAVAGQSAGAQAGANVRGHARPAEGAPAALEATSA